MNQYAKSALMGFLFSVVFVIGVWVGSMLVLPTAQAQRPGGLVYPMTQFQHVTASRRLVFGDMDGNCVDMFVALMKDEKEKVAGGVPVIRFGTSIPNKGVVNAGITQYGGKPYWVEFTRQNDEFTIVKWSEIVVK